MQCPFPGYARLRAEAPVYFAESVGAYIVTRHDLLSEVLRDPGTYSSRRGRSLQPLSGADREDLIAAQSEGYPRLATLLTADPPQHTRFRRLVSKAFSPPAIAAREPLVRGIATRLIDSWFEASRIEFVEQFAVPLPLEVIAGALNVPDDRLEDFKRWSDDTVVGFGNQPTMAQILAAERGVNDLQHYLAGELAARRVLPQDDLLTALLDARIDDDDPEIADRRELDVPEVLSIIQQLLVGGNETTTKMLTEMVRRLAEDPDLWRRVKNDPSLIPSVVEEAIRFASPVQAIWRVAARDTELGGVAIPRGSRLVVSFGSANRDEVVFADADDFQPDRANLHEHLGFGRGVHFCIGASLARMEGRVALEELTARLASLSPADTNDFTYHDSFMLRGLLKLDLDIVPA